MLLAPLTDRSTIRYVSPDVSETGVVNGSKIVLVAFVILPLESVSDVPISVLPLL